MLYKKMLRDLWTHKGAYIASMLLVMIGILTYNMMSMLYESFDYSLYNYYETYNIGDATLKVSGMPMDKVQQIAKIDGVKFAEGRLEKRVRLLDNDKDKEVIFQLMSYDSDNENRLDDIELMGGRMPDPNNLEIIIGNNYFMAMNMNLGDKLPVVINGKKYNFEVVGYGRSPEFVYAKKNNNELISNPKTFDLAFMPYKKMSEIFSLENQVNNVAFTLYDKGKFNDAKNKIKEIVYSYGIQEILPLEDQVSHSLTVQKLEGIGSMTTSVPIMFLMISGFIIFIVLKRIIEQQRIQIGVLKACGVTDMKILIHYISFAFIVGLLGGFIGAYIGISSVPVLIDLMGIAFNMPFETSGLFQKYMLNSFLLSVGFSIISGYAGARSCLALEPSEAMHPPTIKGSKEGLLDKFYWIFEHFDFKMKLALRNILRNKGRSLFIVFGIAITVALLTFPVSMNSMYEKMLFDQFEKIETYDMKITFNTLMDKDSVVKDIANRPGITRVEPQMIIPVEFSNEWRKKETAIVCLPVDSKLYNLYDTNDKPIKLTQDGITMSHWLAKKLKLKVGDKVIVTSPMFGEGEKKEIFVSQIAPQYIGSNGYMNINLTEGLLDGKNYISSLMINGTKEGLKDLHDELAQLKTIGAFDYSAEIAAGFSEYLKQTTAVIWLLVIVGIGIGFSVIYVSLTITLSERRRELATMLVVGLNDGEVHKILLIEQFILSIIGIIFGLPMGKALLIAFAETSSSDSLVLPAIVPNEALLFSILFTIVAIAIPQYFARRSIGKIIVTEALNARE